MKVCFPYLFCKHIWDGSNVYISSVCKQNGKKIVTVENLATSSFSIQNLVFQAVLYKGFVNALVFCMWKSSKIPIIKPPSRHIWTVLKVISYYRVIGVEKRRIKLWQRSGLGNLTVHVSTLWKYNWRRRQRWWRHQRQPSVHKGDFKKAKDTQICIW